MIVDRTDDEKLTLQSSTTRTYRILSSHAYSDP